MTLDQKYYGIYRGIVTGVLDPDKAQRVRVSIAGMTEPDSVWASPKGLFGAAFGLGIVGVPPEGSEVYVQFEAGNLESPIYEPIGIPANEIPEELRGKPNVWGFLFGDIRMIFELTGDQKGKIRLYSKTLEDYNYIELNAEDNSISLNSLTTLNIDAKGLVAINGAVVTIQNRPVTPAGKDI